MDTTGIQREIKDFLVKNSALGRTEAFRDDEPLLGKVIDSTGVIELVTFLQERFSIVVEDDEIVPENLGSVQNIVGYVTKKVRTTEAK